MVWGEGYHATHHADSNKNRFGKFDLGGFLIKLLNKK